MEASDVSGASIARFKPVGWTSMGIVNQPRSRTAVSARHGAVELMQPLPPMSDGHSIASEVSQYSVA